MDGITARMRRALSQSRKLSTSLALSAIKRLGGVTALSSGTAILMSATPKHPQTVVWNVTGYQLN